MLMLDKYCIILMCSDRVSLSDRIRKAVSDICHHDFTCAPDSCEGDANAENIIGLDAYLMTNVLMAFESR